jgi:hypothetical protein
MKGVLPCLVRWACRAATRDFYPALADLVGPVQNIFSLAIHSSVHLSPSPRKLGRQSCWVACLLICVSGILTKNVISDFWYMYKNTEYSPSPGLMRCSKYALQKHLCALCIRCLDTHISQPLYMTRRMRQWRSTTFEGLCQLFWYQRRTTIGSCSEMIIYWESRMNRRKSEIKLKYVWELIFLVSFFMAQTLAHFPLDELVFPLCLLVQ